MSSCKTNKTCCIFAIVLSVPVLLFVYKVYPVVYHTGDVLRIVGSVVNEEATDKCYNDSTFDFDPAFSKRGIPGYYRKLRNCTRKQQMKTILTYHDFWGWMQFVEPFKNCPVSSCVVTNDSSSMPIQNYDAIIFHTFKNITPQVRSPDQKYIFFSLESPYNTRYTYSRSPHFFNWTMTFRRDSDVHFPYNTIRKQETDYELPSLLRIQEKTKMVAWLVSNCVTSGTRRRQDYVAELQKYIQVDVYGACGTLHCSENCYEMIENDYLFYLSFENTMCFDYVTEKVFNVLKYDIVPVVMGYADYESIAPPNSVINVDDFPTPRHLANHLLKIKNDPRLYLNYFKWKKSYVVADEKTRSEYVFCQLCDLLHRPLSHSSYDDVETWFHGYNCYEYS